MTPEELAEMFKSIPNIGTSEGYATGTQMGRKAGMSSQQIFDAWDAFIEARGGQAGEKPREMTMEEMLRGAYNPAQQQDSASAEQLQPLMGGQLSSGEKAAPPAPRPMTVRQTPQQTQGASIVPPVSEMMRKQRQPAVGSPRLTADEVAAMARVRALEDLIRGNISLPQSQTIGLKPGTRIEELRKLPYTGGR